MDNLPDTFVLLTETIAEVNPVKFASFSFIFRIISDNIICPISLKLILPNKVMFWNNTDSNPTKRSDVSAKSMVPFLNTIEETSGFEIVIRLFTADPS